MNSQVVDHIARAILYEGYILFPYRPTPLTPQQRVDVGVVVPASADAEQGPTQIGTQCLIQATLGDAVYIHLRFLHLCTRHDADGVWEEASERSVIVSVDLDDIGVRDSFHWPGCREASRSQETLRADVDVLVDTIANLTDVFRLTVLVTNTTPLSPGASDRASVLRHSLVSTHLVLEAPDGAFVSFVDPPSDLAAAAVTCKPCGLWPVLIGDPGSHDAMLAAPVMLADYPRVASGSDADFLDGTELDEMLVLRILALTDEEKARMRCGDDKARRLLERAERLTAEEILALPGAGRASLSPGKEPAS